MIIMTSYKRNNIHYLLSFHEQFNILPTLFLEKKEEDLYVDCFYKYKTRCFSVRVLLLLS